MAEKLDRELSACPHCGGSQYYITMRATGKVREYRFFATGMVSDQFARQALAFRPGKDNTAQAR